MTHNGSTPNTPEFIGAGRSAQVFRGCFEDGREFAQKIFTGEGASRAVLHLLTGAENPYRWCEAAMASAAARREVLGYLLSFWFGNRVRLPELYDWGWNAERKAYQFRVELIQGTHVPLKNPIDDRQPDRFLELNSEIMQPLQSYLAYAGFDGVVWQAGLGNPVAANNFMLEQDQSGRHRWVWIDLESGVPALFALNLRHLFTYYLPKSFQHGRPLFDDVDVSSLRRYIDEHGALLREAIGADFEKLLSAVDKLDQAQQEWLSLDRLERGLVSAQRLGELSVEEAAFYRERPVRWQLRRLKDFVVKASGAMRDSARSLTSRVRNANLGKAINRSGKYLSSTGYRALVAELWVNKFIRHRADRGGLTKAQQDDLRIEMREGNVSELLTDFSVHLAMKPLVKILAWTVVPALWLTGQIGTAHAAFLAIMMGAIARTGYTGFRWIQALGQGQPLPSVALLLSPLPAVGNMAYPIQLLARSRRDQDPLARFIVAELSAMVGRKLPIWGGLDSGTEHWGQYAGLRLVRLFAKPEPQVNQVQAETGDAE